MQRECAILEGMATSSQRGSIHLASLFAVHLKSEMKELYQFSLIFSFANSLITIFEPIFFYQQAFSLSTIALYYAVHYLLYVLVLPLGAKFAARFGMERSLAVSLPIFVLYFLTLAAVVDTRGLFWVAMVLLTLHKMLYWPAYNALLAQSGDGHNRGTELSWLTGLRFGVGILGPLIGGVIAAWVGFQALFLVTAGTVLLSAFPLLRTRERYRPISLPYSTPWRIILSRRHRGMVLAMCGMGENLVDLVYWPIFMFIMLGSTDRVGVISAITVGVMSLLGFVIGEMSDRFSRRTVLRLHLPFMIVGYLFRPLALSPIGVLLTDLLNKMAYIGVNLPMSYRLYEQGKSVGQLRYATAYEMMLAITKTVVAFFFVWLFATTLPFTGFIIAFVLSALWALMYLFL